MSTEWFGLAGFGYKVVPWLRDLACCRQRELRDSPNLGYTLQHSRVCRIEKSIIIVQSYFRIYSANLTLRPRGKQRAWYWTSLTTCSVTRPQVTSYLVSQKYECIPKTSEKIKIPLATTSTVTFFIFMSSSIRLFSSLKRCTNKQILHIYLSISLILISARVFMPMTLSSTG